MTERRFTEAEVAAIFKRAAETQQQQQQQQRLGAPQDSGSSEGLTLATLQEIGRDVGIPADAIARAAREVDRGELPASPSRTFLGLPLGVERTVHLDRKLSDEEWERFVVLLRDTFDARGTVRSQGSLRQWTNGNLQALLEPTATGQRIRLRTIKGGAVGALAGGIGMFGVAAVMLLAAVVQGALGDTGLLSALAALGLGGASMFVASAFQLPRWARTRQRQMEEIAAQVANETTTTTLLPPPPRAG